MRQRLYRCLIKVCANSLYIVISYIIKFSLSVCVRVCEYVCWSGIGSKTMCTTVMEAFAGDSVGLGLGQQLNFIFKKIILRYFWGKIAPDEKILITYQAGALQVLKPRLLMNE